MYATAHSEDFLICVFAASRDGARLFVTVGSNSNVAENGIENEVNRAAILEVDPATGRSRLFASGMRNPNGLDWQPHSGALWTVVNERDELGSDLVPDYMTSVQEGAFYGWPYSYFGQHVDAQSDALGRPVGVAVDRAGALLVADDVGNVIWRVTPAATKH